MTRRPERARGVGEGALWLPGLFRQPQCAISDTWRCTDFDGLIVLWGACDVPAMAWTGSATCRARIAGTVSASPARLLHRFNSGGGVGWLILPATRLVGPFGRL
jgi:hypothetical protein